MPSFEDYLNLRSGGGIGVNASRQAYLENRPPVHRGIVGNSLKGLEDVLGGPSNLISRGITIPLTRAFNSGDPYVQSKLDLLEKSQENVFDPIYSSDILNALGNNPLAHDPTDSMATGILKGIGRFGVDVVSDPLSYVDFGAHTALGKLTARAGAAARAGEKISLGSRVAQEAGKVLERPVSAQLIKDLKRMGVEAESKSLPDQIRSGNKAFASFIVPFTDVNVPLLGGEMGAKLAQPFSALSRFQIGARLATRFGKEFPELSTSGLNDLKDLALHQTGEVTLDKNVHKELLDNVTRELGLPPEHVLPLIRKAAEEEARATPVRAIKTAAAPFAQTWKRLFSHSSGNKAYDELYNKFRNLVITRSEAKIEEAKILEKQMSDLAEKLGMDREELNSMVTAEVERMKTDGTPPPPKPPTGGTKAKPKGPKPVTPVVPETSIPVSESKYSATRTFDQLLQDAGPEIDKGADQLRSLGIEPEEQVDIPYMVKNDGHVIFGDFNEAHRDLEKKLADEAEKASWTPEQKAQYEFFKQQMGDVVQPHLDEARRIVDNEEFPDPTDVEEMRAEKYREEGPSIEDLINESSREASRPNKNAVSEFIGDLEDISRSSRATLEQTHYLSSKIDNVRNILKHVEETGGEQQYGENVIKAIEESIDEERNWREPRLLDFPTGDEETGLIGSPTFEHVSNFNKKQTSRYTKAKLTQKLIDLLIFPNDDLEAGAELLKLMSSEDAQVSRVTKEVIDNLTSKYPEISKVVKKPTGKMFAPATEGKWKTAIEFERKVQGHLEENNQDWIEEFSDSQLDAVAEAAREVTEDEDVGVDLMEKIEDLYNDINPRDSDEELIKQFEKANEETNGVFSRFLEILHEKYGHVPNARESKWQTAIDFERKVKAHFDEGNRNWNEQFIDNMVKASEEAMNEANIPLEDMQEMDDLIQEHYGKIRFEDKDEEIIKKIEEADRETNGVFSKFLEILHEQYGHGPGARERQAERVVEKIKPPTTPIEKPKPKGHLTVPEAQTKGYKGLGRIYFDREGNAKTGFHVGDGIEDAKRAFKEYGFQNVDEAQFGHSVDEVSDTKNIRLGDIGPQDEYVPPLVKASQPPTPPGRIPPVDMGGGDGIPPGDMGPVPPSGNEPPPVDPRIVEMANQIRELQARQLEIEMTSGVNVIPMTADIDYIAHVMTPEVRQLLRDKMIAENKIPRGLGPKEMSMKLANAVRREFATVKPEVVKDWLKKGMISKNDYKKLIGKDGMDYLDKLLKKGEAITDDEYTSAVHTLTVAEVNKLGQEGKIGIIGNKKVDEFFHTDPVYSTTIRGVRGERARTAAEFYTNLKTQGLVLPEDKAPAGWMPMRQPEMQGYMAPPEVANAMDRWHRIITDPKEFNAFLELFDKTQDWWKAWTLAIFPAYHTRNFVGNMWNNWLAGVHDPKVYQMAYDLLEKNKMMNITTGMGRKLDTNQIIALAKELGVIDRGFVAKDVASTIEQELAEGKLLTFGRNNKILRKGFDFGRRIENNARMGHFLDMLINKGYSASEAAMSVKKYLFDYSELTDFERQVMKRFFPFYAWTRNNVPLQLQHLILEPAKFGAIFKAQNTFDQATPADEKYLPEWMTDNIPVRIRKGKDGKYEYFLLNNWLPAADLGKLVQLHQTAATMLTPLPKEVLQQMFNYDYFLKRKIETIPGQKEKFIGMNLPVRVTHGAKVIRLLNEIDKLSSRDQDIITKVNALVTGKTYMTDPTKLVIGNKIRVDQQVDEMKKAIRQEARKTNPDQREIARIQAMIQEISGEY